MNYAVLALLGLVSAEQVPVGYREYTQEMLDNHLTYLNALGDQKIDIMNFQDSEYYINMNVGTPAQTFEVVPSTLHSNTWVLGDGCHTWVLNSYCWGKTVFESKKSSSFKKNGKAITLGVNQGIISNDKVNLGGINAQMDFAEIYYPLKTP